MTLYIYAGPFRFRGQAEEQLARLIASGTSDAQIETRPMGQFDGRVERYFVTRVLT